MNTTIINTEVERKIIKIIANESGLKEEKITRKMVINTDFGFDSLTIVEIVMAIEEEFGIEIPDEDADKINTIGEAVDYVIDKTKKI